jgi:hypothetical protein
VATIPNAATPAEQAGRTVTHHGGRQKARHHRKRSVQEPSELGGSDDLTDTIANWFGSQQLVHHMEW